MIVQDQEIDDTDRDQEALEEIALVQDQGTDVVVAMIVDVEIVVRDLDNEVAVHVQATDEKMIKKIIH